MRLVYKKTSLEDLDVLTQTRIVVLRAANGLDDTVDMSAVEAESRRYYQQALKTGEHIAYLVYDKEQVVATGGISFYQVQPTYHNQTGRKAYIMNMYTMPQYRRKGIALEMLRLLVKEGKQKGVSHISLEATDMGKPLYQKYGFVTMQNEMILLNDK